MIKSRRKLSPCLSWIPHRWLITQKRQPLVLLILVFLFLCGVMTFSPLLNSPYVFTSPEDLLSSLLVPEDGRCLMDWTRLKEQKIDTETHVSMAEVIRKHPETHPGGWWRPTNCKPWQRVAIVIPYRDRWEHLKILLNRILPMLQKQQIHYKIYVIQQTNQSVFNRGKIKNIGFLESKKDGHFDCVIFHDVDMLPEHDANYYLCDHNARHLTPYLDELDYRIPYWKIFGGVVALKPLFFERVNGYSNLYWSWGAEDDDLSERVRTSGILIARPLGNVGRYKMIKHKKDVRESGENFRLCNWKSRWSVDGLNDPVGLNYTVMQRREHPLYTNITVDIGKPQANLNAMYQQGVQTSYNGCDYTDLSRS